MKGPTGAIIVPIAPIKKYLMRFLWPTIYRDAPLRCSKLVMTLSKTRQIFTKELRYLTTPSKFVILRCMGYDFYGHFRLQEEINTSSVVVDYLSKWVEAKVLPTNDARVVFAKVMSNYGVTHRLATSYHPQMSGQVEVSNRGFKCILERTVGENRFALSWSDYGQIIMKLCGPFRTAFKTPIGRLRHTSLFMEVLPSIQLSYEHKAYWALISMLTTILKSLGDHWKLQLNELNELRDQAYENSLIYKERTKKLHDSKIKTRIFNVGD
ncbi:reverse transcriptase domain-containing protein [Tanacetum coccineum]|uniref:Reverse transcriptase domain-containing protein n=1 Tax=Tanacetum coccineum TaxID=301880 RepID=A0ABQ5DCW3_9ASTR